ncbi:MAG: hypothetical protein ACRC8Y_11225 [Chroococcales cyanobacterium]
MQAILRKWRGDREGDDKLDTNRLGLRLYRDCPCLYLMISRAISGAIAVLSVFCYEASSRHYNRSPLQIVRPLS